MGNVVIIAVNNVYNNTSENALAFLTGDLNPAAMTTTSILDMTDNTSVYRLSVQGETATMGALFISHPDWNGWHILGHHYIGSITYITN